MSVVRNNLMNQENYRPYCGKENCYLKWPRTVWNGKQFECRCGWVSQFSDAFIEAYKMKWGK